MSLFFRILIFGTIFQSCRSEVRSYVDVAAQLTSLALGNSVCDTWIFPQNFKTKVTSWTYAHLSLGHLRPLVLIDQTYFKSDIIFSYAQEFLEDDIINSNRLGVRQYATNCASLFIDTLVTTNSVQNTVDVTLNLISHKFGRPHKDYFIFSTSTHDLLKQVFSASTQIREIRYRYALVQEVETTANQNFVGKSQLFLKNFCSTGSDHLELFSRKCDTHIIGKHFQIVATSISPFVHISFDDEPTKSKTPSGILFSLFVETSLRRNFTFEIRTSGFLGSSGFKRNGTWYGAVGEVFKREADIAFGVATTVHRFPINDPGVTQVWITRYFYIRSPPFQMSWGSIFWSLTPTTWALTGAIVLFLVLPVYYACAVFYFRTHNSRPSNILSQLIEAIWRIMMEQSATLRMWKGTRIRLMIILWTAFCLVIGTGYRSKLITFLTFLEQAPIPLTHNDLSLSDYELYFRWMGGVAYRYTADSPDPMHKRIMKRAVMVNTSADGLFRALLNPNAAWLDYNVNAEFAIQRYATLNPNMKENPLFVKSKDSDYTCHIVWSFRKGSPLVESLDSILLEILAAGLYDFYEQDNGYRTRVRGAEWLRTNNDTTIKTKLEEIMESLDEKPKPLYIGALLGVFLILAAGACAGFGAWAGEIVLHFGRKIWFRKIAKFYRLTFTWIIAMIGIPLEPICQREVSKVDNKESMLNGMELV